MPEKAKNSHTCSNNSSWQEYNKSVAVVVVVVAILAVFVMAACHCAQSKRVNSFGQSTEELF